MGRQTYLLRRNGRYHFRRRFAFAGSSGQHIMLALGTADPVDARRIVNRLAVRWDEMKMQATRRIERGTLTLQEQRALFRQGLEHELADATRHVSGPSRPAIDEASYSKVAVAAYTIVGSVPHDAANLSIEMIETQINDSWTDAERRLLMTMLRLYITPMTVSRSDAVDALETLGTPVNDGTATEARWNLIRGRIEAQKRATLVDHPLFADRDVPAYHLLDDDLVQQARRVSPLRPAPVEPMFNTSKPSDTADTGYFARSTTIRFSEQLDDMLSTMVLNKKYKPDSGQRRRVLETFAWITGDKPMSDYGPEDRIAFVKAMTKIPKTVRFGEFGKSGPMAMPFDARDFDAPTAETVRSFRTINRDLTILAAAEAVLHETHWRPRYGGDRVLNFLKSWTKIEDDFANPKRVPWTPEHLRKMYSLPLWQGGGGGSNERIKPVSLNKVYQDAAYWLPLFGTYMGVAREEGAGFEVVDFNFEGEVPYVLVQANMTRSKDGGLTKGGLKRKARHRVMPLHPQLLKLGIQRYVEAIEAEGHGMIFPELYLPEAKYARPSKRSDGATHKVKKAEAFGGRRFYAIAWCFLMDATHGIMPLPETSDGKKADFHSQRTYNNSVLASPEVSQTIIDKHMGHAPKGTGPRNYMRRSLALGEVRELRERLDVMIKEMPIVTDHVPVQDRVNLLPMIERSRVGSAPGRNAKHRFCA